MRAILAALAVVACSMISFRAQAFDRCQDFYTTPEALQQILSSRVLGNTPMKYEAKARYIRIVTEEPTGVLLPTAKFDSPEAPAVIYPTTFPPVLCRLALATYIVYTGNDQPFIAAAHDAARCIFAHLPFESCLASYARDLERRYRAAFAALPAREQDIAYTFAGTALVQIARHEFAHHLLNHAERIRTGQIARIDAEFEADFYAVSVGIQVGEYATAMAYFFEPLRALELDTASLKNSDYESFACRTTNVGDISKAIGTATPTFLLAVARGRGAERGAKVTMSAYLRTLAGELARPSNPTPNIERCGRLSGLVLREARAELARLTALVADNDELLEAKPQNGDPYGDQALDDPKVFALVDRLQELSRSFQRLNGLTVQVISTLIARVALHRGREAKIAEWVDQMTQSSTDDILSGDYGRILKNKALIVLYSSPDRRLADRLAEAQRLFAESVRLLPMAAESWMNLALIAFATGDCDKAADYAQKSLDISGPSPQLNTEFFVKTVREFGRSGRCAEEGGKFSQKIFVH